jgi:hypothetical protein
MARTYNMKASGITVTDLMEFGDGQPVFLHRAVNQVSKSQKL